MSSLSSAHLPDDWTTGPLSTLTVRTRTRDPRNGSRPTFTYVDVSSVSNTRFKIVGATDMPIDEAPSRARKELRAGDVLFATVRPTLKRVALVPPELDGQIASTGFCVIRPNPAVADHHFLYFAALTDTMNQRMAELQKGASYPAVRDSDVLGQIIPIPPLDEQREIAAVLNLVQRAIEQQERLIALTTELKQALLHKLFTEGLHGKPQKMTEIGLIPESWEVVRLGDYTDRPQYGLSEKAGDQGQYPILRMTNQVDGEVLADDLKYVDLRDADAERFKMRRGDILFNRTNSHDLVGRTARFDLEGDFVFASYLIRFGTDEERLRSRFVNALLNWDATQRRLKGIAARAVSQSNISASRLSSFEIALPTLPEQDAIVEMLDGASNATIKHRQTAAVLTDLFRTLLQQLMTAQVRVDDIEPSALLT